MFIGTKRVIAILGTVTLLAVASACGQGSDSSSDDGQTEITFLNPHAGAYDEVVKQFMVAYPDIKVEQQSVPFEQLVSQIEARLGSGDSTIDVVSVDPPRLPSMADKGYLMDLSANLPEMEETFSAVGLDSVTWEGQQWAYPQWTSDNFLFYNIELLEEAGIPLPGEEVSDRMTWEDVLSDAQTIQENSSADYGLLIEQVDRYYAIQSLLMSQGAESGLTGEGNLTPEVNTPEWLEFGKWYGDLYESGLSPRGVDPAQMADLFKSGKGAYMLAGPTRIADLQDSDLKDKWGIAPHPYFDGQQIVTPTDSWAMGVSAFSEEQEAALKFVQFATASVEGAIATSSILTLPPVNTEAADDYRDYLADIAGEQTKNLMEVIELDSEENAVQRPRSIGYVDFETIMNKAFADIRNGVDVSEVLNDSQDSLERSFSRY